MAISFWHKDSYRLKIMMQISIWLILLVAFSVVMLPEMWQARLTTSGRLEMKSTQERVEYYSQAKDLIKDYWYQGVGIGSFTQATYNQDASKEVWNYQPVHNIYLLVMTEVGIFGGLIFLLIVFEFFRRVLGRCFIELKEDNWFLVYSLAFVSLLIIGPLDHYLWSLSFGMMLFWLVLGLWLKRYQEV